MIESDKKEFITFLKRYKAYSAYRHNIRTPNFINTFAINRAKEISSFTIGTDPKNLIDSTFYWYRTKEGYDYWNRLNDIWRTNCYYN